MGKRGNNNRIQRNYRKAGDLNRKSTHELRTHDGMMRSGVNPYDKMLGLSKRRRIK